MKKGHPKTMIYRREGTIYELFPVSLVDIPSFCEYK